MLDSIFPRDCWGKDTSTAPNGEYLTLLVRCDFQSCLLKLRLAIEYWIFIWRCSQGSLYEVAYV